MTETMSMERILLELLQDLEAIGEDHEELFDSEVRDRMGEAILAGFVRSIPNYVVSDDLGMFNDRANRRVKEALQSYIEAASPLATELGLVTFHQRLAAFQNPEVRTSGHGWNNFDEFFGTTKSDCYDADGNVVNPNAT